MNKNVQPNTIWSLRLNNTENKKIEKVKGDGLRYSLQVERVFNVMLML